MSIQGKNPAAKAYPKVGGNTTRGIASNQGRTVKAEPGRGSVNVAQGPRTGVSGAAGKRASFQEAKEAREPLATIINDAYAKRAHEYAEFEYTNGGSIHDNTYEHTKKHGVKLGKSNKTSRGA